LFTRSSKRLSTNPSWCNWWMNIVIVLYLLPENWYSTTVHYLDHWILFST
jgi:hypothetical protein